MAARAKPAPRRSPPRTAPKPRLAAPHIAVVLDETGSMEAVKAATISSYNEYLGSLQRDPNARGARFALTRFNSLRTATDGPADVSEAKQLTGATYRPDGMTDLYDAVGRTIARLDREVERGPVIVVILTDGHENSSREYTRAAVAALIAERQATGRWTFVYLGANQDAWAVGRSMGIPTGNAMAFDASPAGTGAAIRAMSASTGALLGAYAGSGLTGTATAMADAGIDRCLACGGRLVLGQAHACGGGGSAR